VALRVNILDLRNGEWVWKPVDDVTANVADYRRLDQAVANGQRPRDIGMKRVGPWRENTWPEGSREAEYEL